MKTPPWSHSLLHSYEVCEHQAYRQYVVKDIPWEPTPERVAGNAAHKALELRLSAQVRLPDGFGRYEGLILPIERFEGERHYEWKLGMQEDGSPCRFHDDDVWGRGVLDVCLIRDRIGMLLDWKTGKVREDPEELEVQAVLLKAHWPGLTRIVGRYVWLRDNQLGQEHDLSDTVVKLASIRQRVEKFRMNLRTGAWQKRDNVLCGWCSVRDCEFNRNRT